MKHDDTTQLLRQCNAGSKMAVNALDQVMPMVSSAKMLRLLMDNKAHHAELGNELHKLAESEGTSEEDPPLLAKLMSEMSINTKMLVHPGDQEIASIITDGCNMGIKSVNEYLNKYTSASKPAKSVSKELIHLEEQLMGDLREFL